MRFSAVLGFILLGSSTLIFGSDTGLRDCQISVAMADGDSLPPGLQLSVFDGERRIAELKVPKTGAMTLSQLQAGKYRILALYGNAANTVRFSINHSPASECKLPLDTGSMHKWNKAEIGTITFPESETHK